MVFHIKIANGSSRNFETSLVDDNPTVISLTSVLWHNKIAIGFNRSFETSLVHNIR